MPIIEAFLAVPKKPAFYTSIDVVSGQPKDDYRADVNEDHYLGREHAPRPASGPSRVARIMDAVLAGLKGAIPTNSDVRQFCLDLGLSAENGDRAIGPSNKIYGEAMSRTLTDEIQHLDIDVGARGGP